MMPRNKLILFVVFLITSFTSTSTLSNQESENDAQIGRRYKENVSLNENSPAMIEIPETYNEILGKQREPGFRNHPGLRAALDAIWNNRSPQNAYILLIGLAGAGKSSTINTLFGRPIAPVNVMSTKSEIVEYSVNVTLTEFGIQNSQLRIIDTPGIGSSNGVEYDARIIASLKNYLSKHEELKSTLPNAVLIFSKFDDNCFQGSNSTFVKMLKGYDMIRDSLIGPVDEPSSIIYLLTRFLRDTPRVARNPARKLQAFREVIRNYTTFPEPIILSVAENEAEEHELPPAGDNYRLPNNELYPQNLIDRITNLTLALDVGRTIASEIFKSVFSNRKTVVVEVRTKQGIFDSRNEAGRETLREMEATDSAIHPSEISEALKEADGRIDPKLRKSYPASLQLLQRAFQTRNIKNITQVPTKRSEIVGFLQDSKMNPTMLALFQKAFSRVIPEFEFELVTGYGYDLLKDKTLQTSPFDFKKLKFSRLGFMLPDGITAKPVNEELNVLHFFKSPKEYMTTRIPGIQAEIKEDIYEAGFRPGYNVIDAKSGLCEIQVTSIREIRKFKLTLNRVVPFNQEFKDSIAELPTFSISDRESVNEWNQIFQKYGTHVVASAFGGGEIETIVSVKGVELDSLKNGTLNNIRSAIMKLPQNSEYTNEFINDLKDGSEIKIGLNGGEYKFKSLNLAEMPLNDITENVDKWERTLGIDAVMLKSKLSISPLSEIVKNLNLTKAIDMQRAMKALLEGTLEYVPPPMPPPTSRPSQGQGEDGFEIIDEKNRQLIANLTQTKKELEERVALEKKHFEDIQRRRQELLTTSRPTLYNNYPILSTQKPVLQTSTNARQVAKDFVWASLEAVDPANYQIRTKIVDLYDDIRAGKLTDVELNLENLKRRVDSIKSEHIPTPTVSRPTTTQEPPSYRNSGSNWDLTGDDSIPMTKMKGPGYMYDILNERFLPRTPFVLNSSSFWIQKCRREESIYFIRMIFSNLQEYLDHRVQQIAPTRSSKMHIKKQFFKGILLPGHATHHTRVTIAKEYREWLVTLKNFERLDRLTVSEEFNTTLNNLPPYDMNYCESKIQWFNFFNQHGTHIIRSAFMGGAIDFTPLEQTFYSTPNIIPDLQNHQLETKNFFVKVLGGDTSIVFRNLNITTWNDIRNWESSIRHRPVMLPTEIKLIPIYKLIEIINPEKYRVSMSAYNDYFDGVLKACDSLCTIPGSCRCPPGQIMIFKNCMSMEGQKCSMDTWDNCVPNSICSKNELEDDFGVCTCRFGFDRTSEGLCLKTYGKMCKVSAECNDKEKLLCNSGFCTCASTVQKFWSNRGCLSQKGQECGLYKKNGIDYMLDCDDGSVCDRETNTCK